MELASFYGGRRGESAYQTWLNLGNQGTEEDFLKSLAEQGTVLYQQQDSNKLQSITFDKTLVNLSTYSGFKIILWNGDLDDVTFVPTIELYQITKVPKNLSAFVFNPLSSGSYCNLSINLELNEINAADVYIYKIVGIK